MSYLFCTIFLSLFRQVRRFQILCCSFSRDTLSVEFKREGSVRIEMTKNFIAYDVDDMIFGSAKQIASER